VLVLVEKLNISIICSFKIHTCVYIAQSV